MNSCINPIHNSPLNSQQNNSQQENGIHLLGTKLKDKTNGWTHSSHRCFQNKRCLQLADCWMVRTWRDQRQRSRLGCHTQAESWNSELTHWAAGTATTESQSVSASLTAAPNNTRWTYHPRRQSAMSVYAPPTMPIVWSWMPPINLPFLLLPPQLRSILVLELEAVLKARLS